MYVVTVVTTAVNRELMTFDDVCWFVGVYGDVIRVKIMFNKKDNALVQFTDPAQANTGM